MHELLPHAALLKRLEIGQPSRYDGLAMFPLVGGKSGAADYETLDEALTHGTLRVREVSRQGSVPELKVDNRGERPVLVLDGEELVGAKQNRVVNLTVLIPALTTVKVPVSCVEMGRWSYRTPGSPRRRGPTTRPGGPGASHR